MSSGASLNTLGKALVRSFGPGSESTWAGQIEAHRIRVFGPIMASPNRSGATREREKLPCDNRTNTQIQSFTFYRDLSASASSEGMCCRITLGPKGGY
jgi:hypothetical protein